MFIKVLEDLVISRIAAGEVIERPASVVKELIENALDAGARTVHIEVRDGGRRLIRVSDDGAGIPSEDVELAITRHATSKLRDVSDLDHIQTLGFRGEALASVASVSHLSITSRYREDEVGTEIQVEGGVLISRSSVGVPAGTVVSVENLFFNTPARLKFQKSINTEKRQITTIVTRYAMAYPGVRFTIVQDGRDLFRSTGSGQLADVVMRVLGVDNFRKMVEIKNQESVRGSYGTLAVYGYVSQPDLNRSDRSRIILFVNGRAVQDNHLNHAVTQAYHTLLMKGRYPYAVLMLDVPPDFVDVNVHPAKSEVRFQDASLVFSALQRSVRRVVVGHAGPPLLHRRRPGTEFTDLQAGRGWSSPYDREPTDNLSQLEMGLPIDDPGQFPLQNVDNEREDQVIPAGLGQPSRPRTLPLLRVIGQVGAAYIVAEGPAGLYLIDQHAAHERILYEQYMEQYYRQETIAQRALDAQTLELPPEDARLLEDHLEALCGIGFELELFGMNTFLIRSVPAMLADNDPADAVAAIIQDLEQEKSPGQDSIEAKIIMRVCKRAAVKAGQVLSVDEMRGLIRQLERCESPHTCPHGRPTLIHMSADQLAREFGRLGAH